MTRRNQWYGWNPDHPDQRDLLFEDHESIMAVHQLPKHVDMRDECPAVYDQGQLGSCTANAIAGAIEFERMKQGLEDFVPSRLFVYFNERVMEYTTNTDSGAMIRDGMWTVAHDGAPPETEWPYDISKFAVTPPQAAYDDARKDLVTKYLRLNQTLQEMKSCLASGYPFVSGFTVYESFESDEVAKTGIVPMPKRGEAVLGGHAVMTVGYDDIGQRFIVRNSWGDGWGMAGYCTIPYAFWANQHLASDFWTTRLVG